MKTSALTGADLNRAVAMALGKVVLKLGNRGRSWYVVHIAPGGPIFGNTEHIPSYAYDIAVAWPIIKKHKIDLQWRFDGNGCNAIFQPTCGEPFIETDVDPQVAAMRCFVASVYGGDIEMEV